MEIREALRRWGFPVLIVSCLGMTAILLVLEAHGKSKATAPGVANKRVPGMRAVSFGTMSTTTATMPTEASSIEVSLPTVWNDGLYEWVQAEISAPLDWNSLVSKMKLWSKLRASDLDKSVKALLEANLFSWISNGKAWPNVDAMAASWQPGKAIVINTGNQFAPLALNLIRGIREIFHHDIPIYIYYMGEKDLNPEMRDLLFKYGATAVVDILPMFGEELKLSGWDARPFSMLACPYQEVMLLDADTVLMQGPDSFFADTGYQDTGALFFIDRLYGGEERKRGWLEKILPKPLSESAKLSTIYTKKANDYQEAGVVLINKARRLKSMLSICLVNTLPLRDELHNFTHGDKESYWIGFEIAMEPYSMMTTPGGCIGTDRDFEGDHREFEKVCGRPAHFDRQGRLMWFNDGVLERKMATGADIRPAILLWMHSSWQWGGFCTRWDQTDLHTPEGWPTTTNRPPWALSLSELNHLHRLIELYLTDPFDPTSSLMKVGLNMTEKDPNAKKFFQTWQEKK